MALPQVPVAARAAEAMPGELLHIRKFSVRRQFPGNIAGTVSIEFAILVPVFLAILFGIIVFGTQYATRIALTYAAAEGGRAAVAGLDKDERSTLAKQAIGNALNALDPLVDPDKAVVTVDLAQAGQQEQITISIAYNDNRFATLPFVPSLNNLAPVTVNYYVTDPSG
jgi:Flp pilus assembly protein TadG